MKHNKGTTSVFPLILIAGVGILGMFALDVVHSVLVHTELQSAADAGALAGAQDLILASTSGNAIADATNIAALNTADGKSCTGAVVSIQANTCTVELNQPITNFCGYFVGQPQTTISVLSTAGAYSSVTAVDGNTLFPIALSWDTLNAGPALKTKMLGDQITITIESQQNSNGDWTGLTSGSHSASDILSLVNGIVNNTPNSVPPVSVGDNINLTGGVGPKPQDFNGQNLAYIYGQPIVLPIITGDPPFTQTRPCIGFLAVQVTNVGRSNPGNGLQLTATIVKGLVKGTGGGTTTGGISPGLVQLIR
jgi:Flp pilus assembly protein TadG